LDTKKKEGVVCFRGTGGRHGRGMGKWKTKQLKGGQRAAGGRVYFSPNGRAELKMGVGSPTKGRCEGGTGAKKKGKKIPRGGVGEDFTRRQWGREKGHRGGTRADGAERTTGCLGKSGGEKRVKDDPRRSKEMKDNEGEEKVP